MLSITADDRSQDYIRHARSPIPIHDGGGQFEISDERKPPNAKHYSEEKQQGIPLNKLNGVEDFTMVALLAAGLFVDSMRGT